ncbi:MAG: F0F1 ATP synthase subunit B [Planctomycetota bacterium]
MLMFLEGGDFNPLEISTGFMFWSVITFALTLVILTKYGWKPLMESIDAREEKIRNDLDQADKARAEAEQLMKSNREQLAKAADEARQLMADTREAGERSKQNLLNEAKEQVESLKVQAEKDIAAARDKAIADIKTHVVEVAMGVSRQIVGNSVDEAEHNRLVEELLKKAKGAA